MQQAYWRAVNMASLAPANMASMSSLVPANTASMVPAATPVAPFMEIREASPAHFLFKIESFSLLVEHKVSKYETGEFFAGGYKWRLVIYPNGLKRERDGESYVSVYLAIADTTTLPSNWEVNASFSICLFNQICCNYCYTLGRTRRFLGMKTEWGFSKFISKKDLGSPSNGFLIDDKCVFGAEVFVNENKAVIEYLSLKSADTSLYRQEFKFENFSTLKDNWTSDEFTAGGYNWEIHMDLNGDGDARGSNLSIFLNYVTPSEEDVPFERVKARYAVCMKNQSWDEHHIKHALECCWGWPSFMKMASLNDPNKGYIVNDCCYLILELSVQAVASGSPSSSLC